MTAEKTREAEDSDQSTGTPSAEFIRAFTQNQRPLYLSILPLVGNATDADEVLQETNLVIWSKWRQFQPGTNFLAWGRAIARLEVFRFRRTRGKKARFLDDELLNLVADKVEETDHLYEMRREALTVCIGKLREKDRQLVRMRYAPNATGDQIATQLNRPPNSVYQSLGRIRRVLMECVKRQLAEIGGAS